MREILSNQTEIMRGLASLLLSSANRERDAELRFALAFNAGRIEQAMTFTLEMLNRK